MLNRQSFFMILHLLGSANTPLPFRRTTPRDTTPSLRGQSLRAGERNVAGTDVATWLQLDDTFGGEHTSAILENIIQASLGGVDLSFLLDPYIHAIATGAQTLMGDEETDIADIFFDRATETITREFRPAIHGIGGMDDDLELEIYDFPEETCYREFRFKTRAELHQVFTLLRFPDTLRIPTSKNGDPSVPSTSCWQINSETAFLVFLHRMAHSTKFTDLSTKFGIKSDGKLCRIFHFVMVWIDDEWSWLVDGGLPEGNIRRWASELELWADAIRARFEANGEGGVSYSYFKDICLFIDGTFRDIQRPGSPDPGLFRDFQRLFYSGHKKRHGLQFQAVVAPNGMFIDLFGPSPGRHNDLYLVRQSDIVRRLRGLFIASASRFTFRCFGDSIYHYSSAICRRIRGNYLSDEQERQNTVVSTERTCVEQLFAKVVQNWVYIDLRRNQRVLSSPSGVGRAYRVAVLLTNFLTCIDQSQVNIRFGLSSPDLENYMEGGVCGKCPIVA